MMILIYVCVFMLISLTECHSGTYGQNCTQSCGKCVAKQPCHYVTGACMNGCERGYQGKQCKTGTMYSTIIKRLISNPNIGFVCILGFLWEEMNHLHSLRWINTALHIF